MKLNPTIFDKRPISNDMYGVISDTTINTVSMFTPESHMTDKT